MSSIMYLFINPRSSWKMPYSATAKLRAALMLFRHYFFAILGIILLLAFLLASITPFESIAGISFTDEEREIYGIGDETDVSLTVPVGGIWDVLWFIRGQKPGFYDGTGEAGYFAIIGATTGLNAPTTVPGLFFEAITDVAVYLPLLLNPLFTLLHLDVTGMFLLKLGGDVLLLGVGIGLLVILLLILTFFSPILLMMLVSMSGPLIRLGIGAGILLLLIVAFAAVIGL